MARNVISIQELGGDVCWLLVQQTMGLREAKMRSDFMTGRVALLLFTRQSLPERLCVTAAMRQTGGSTIYQGELGGEWRQEVHTFQEHLVPIFDYYLDCLYLYGFPLERINRTRHETRFPVINAGGGDAHPAHVLADLACMIRQSRDLKGMQAAWIGCDNGTLNSLVEAMAWFPFSLRISLPPKMNPAPLRERARELAVPVSFFHSPAEAARGADFIYAGCRADLTDEELGEWRINAEIMRNAAPDAKLFLSASPARAISIAPEVLSSKASMLVRQAEARLKAHKRILHWVFE